MSRSALSLLPSHQRCESGVVLHLADGTIQACNQTAQTILGLTPEQLQGWSTMHSPWKTIQADGSPFSSDDYPAMITLRTGQPCTDVVMGLYRPDGELVWLCVTTEPLWGAGTTPYGAIATFTDITEKVITEEMRSPQASSSSTSAAPELNLTPDTQAVDLTEEAPIFFKCSPDFLAILDLQGRFKRVNGRFTELLGYGERELLNQPLMEFVHPGDRLVLQTELDNLQTGLPAAQITTRYRAKDGTYRYLSWTASSQLARGVIYGIARDVTQHKQIEAALQASEERWQLALRGTNDGIWDWNVQTNEVFFSPQWKQMLGFEEPEIGNHLEEWSNRVHPDDLEQVMQAIRDHFDGKTPFYTSEHRVQCKDGSYKWILDRGRAIWDEMGKVVRMVGSHTDITYDIAERRRLEGFIRRSEQQIRRILDSLFSFVGMLTPDGILLEANRTALDAAALSPADVLGKRFEETFWWSYAPEVQARLRAAIARAAQGEIVRYDATVRVKNDQLIIIDFSLAPLFDEAGQVEFLVPSGIDISDRKRTEVALQESQKKLQRQLAEIETIYQSAPVGLNVLDAKLRFVRINQQLAEMNGFSVEEHLGRTVGELLPDLGDTAEALLRSVLATGEPLLNVEIRGETPAQPGIERVWLESFLPLKEGDRVIGINTVCQEITEQIQSENALRQATERLKTALRSAPLTLFNQDSNLRYTWIHNPAQNYTVEEVIGCRDEDLFSPDTAAYLTQLKQRVLDTGVGVREEVKVFTRDGTMAYYDLTIDPLWNSQDAVVGITCGAFDISDRKRIEAQREYLLEREQAAREAAEHANRMKDEFLAMLSHELRTPLNPILGWSKLLQAPNMTSERLQQGLSAIERNAKQQAQLVDDLLDISRIIRGQITLNLSAVLLTEPVLAALETVRLAAEAKAIHIELALDSHIGFVRGDASRLQQVVWNLLANAVKFTPAGGQVTVSLSAVDGYAQLQIRDNGKGIRPDFLPHVFELFNQQDSSISRSFGGLGLGLAIARRVVETHGGTILAESPGEGQGATFTVRLPLMPSPKLQMADSAGHASYNNLKTLRVMVVDDEIDSLQLVEVLLQGEVADVTTVLSATDALEQLKQSAFDLLISDIGMPKMDGYELIQQVRTQAGGNANIPAIALTAYAGEANQRQILAAGFQAHLAKPFDPVTLLEKIASLVST